MHVDHIIQKAKLVINPVSFVDSPVKHKNLATPLAMYVACNS